MGGRLFSCRPHILLIERLLYYIGKACVMKEHLSRIWRTGGESKWISERKHVLVPGKWSNKARAPQGEWP